MSGSTLDRNAAVRYGKFIDAAYTMFEHPIGDPLLPTPSNDFPSDHTMTAWIQMSDFAFGGGKRLKFYGFVAQDKANPESHIIVIRGTEGLIEWYDDAVAVPTTFKPAPEVGTVSSGFDRIYETLQVIACPPPRLPGIETLAAVAPRQMSGTFADQIEELLQGSPSTVEVESFVEKAVVSPELVVTGHSLGGALCTLYVMEHAAKKQADSSRRVTINGICTFASPRVGMKEFVEQFNALPIDSWRIMNEQDIVPKLPPSIPLVLPYQHVDTLYGFSSSGMVKFNPKCWHSMLTYLHWLDSRVDLDSACSLGGPT